MAAALAALVVACAAAAPRRPVTMVPDARVAGSFGSGSASRRFVLFRPASALAREAGARPLLVVLHGCAQDAADIARGTRLDSAAAREGLLVLYPEQPERAHPKKCWNWYLPGDVRRDSGEVALLAALADSVRAAEGGAPRVLLAGMSAGAAMAANFAAEYPERVAALALHSGIPALAAMDVMTALRVMRAGPVGMDAPESAAIAAMGARARVIPVIALQGDADAVVSPANLDAVARQWVASNAQAGSSPVPLPVTLTRDRASGRRWTGANGTVSVEAWRLQGVAHAWSGGSAAGTFTDPGGPDATAMILDFFHRAGVLTSR